MTRREYAQKLIESQKDRSRGLRLEAYEQAMRLGLITLDEIWKAEGLTETVWEAGSAELGGMTYLPRG